ncbi:MAG: hypothetical protein IPO78_09730 [Saprospiraceae bacterium]|nr:hypothetical protein [Saprospiraceae bacterium]MBK8450167.1 hypothetical protein [Saprospiraceae bacterium]MBK9221188.1 hypothetical protein [Saprospiraceae bacterium]MBK9721877.1 hypothetical protein [Saprospiraceae bacterium]
MKNHILTLALIWICSNDSFSQTQIKEKLYTKSCDTVSIDSMICIKCTNAALTLGCKKYACDFKNHCIPMPVVPPKNKSKDIKTTLPGGTQKKG